MQEITPPLHEQLETFYESYKGELTDPELLIGLDDKVAKTVTFLKEEANGELGAPLSLTAEYKQIARFGIGALLSTVVAIGVPVGSYFLFSRFGHLLSKIPSFSLVKWDIYTAGAAMIGLTTLSGGGVAVSCSKGIINAKSSLQAKKAEQAAADQRKAEIKEHIPTIQQALSSLSRTDKAQNEEGEGVAELQSLILDLGTKVENL